VDVERAIDALVLSQGCWGCTAPCELFELTVILVSTTETRIPHSKEVCFFGRPGTLKLLGSFSGYYLALSSIPSSSPGWARHENWPMDASGGNNEEAALTWHSLRHSRSG